MWITPLTALIALLVIFTSGRLVLSYLPPGWPGWAPGMGTRELGATIGASGLLGNSLLWLSGKLSAPIFTMLGGDPMGFGPLRVQIYLFFAVNALLALGAILRAPAKLRPRHEYAYPNQGWAIRVLATVVVCAALIPTLDWLEVLGPDGPKAIGQQLSASTSFVTPIAITLLLVGALKQLRRTSWMPWVVAGGVLSCYLFQSYGLKNSPHYSIRTSLLGALLCTAVAFWMVWNRRADKRARALAYLLLATFSIQVDNSSAFAVLCVLWMALTSRSTQISAWPWHALSIIMVIASAQVVWQYLVLQHIGPSPHFSLTEFVQPITIGDIRLQSPLALLFITLLIALWITGPWSNNRDESLGSMSMRREKRALWTHIAFVPLALLLGNWWLGATFTSSFEGAIAMDLRSLLLGCMPSLVLLAGIQLATALSNDQTPQAIE